MTGELENLLIYATPLIVAGYLGYTYIMWRIYRLTGQAAPWRTKGIVLGLLPAIFWTVIFLTLTTMLTLQPIVLVVAFTSMTYLQLLGGVMLFQYMVKAVRRVDDLEEGERLSAQERDDGEKGGGSAVDP